VAKLARPAFIFVLSAAAPGAAPAADPALIEAARREGAVVWYTAQIVDQF
jgi:hypothetical protein